MESKKVLTIDEACAYLGYKKSYLYKLTMSGIIPFSKPNGKKLFFEKIKLEAWMLSNANPGSNERGKVAATYVTSEKKRR
ncbi:helix-turn-helix domain-containing protein [Agriterribacter sp.]|uniref:helix-turn-helix domain-containing protein n=1 Tax=Agriterribacter sp. TaxID=2821509 RepID=UPI002CF14516|nr:helix-turn-helix domain-containing protein [Agriterribacter sp.]HRO47327.1 helix-turn-helix domain-containing protein [Agriterribacter sp.]HRQ18164.1 helix-turn-helix domain-containing protein [Agriterribacter sp.]